MQFPCSSQFTDPSTCNISVTSPTSFESSKGPVSSCTLYHDKGPESWLRKTSTDAWLSTGVGEAIDGTDGAVQDHGDVYCVVCYENGNLEIFDVPNFSCVFSVENFLSGKSHLVDVLTKEVPKDSQKGDKVSDGVGSQDRKDALNMKVVELAMQRWSGKHSRPFLFGILSDGTTLCYHAYLYESPDGTSKVEDSVSAGGPVGLSNTSVSRLRNLRFVRVPLDVHAREETSNGSPCQQINIFKNLGNHEGFFLLGSRPAWVMVLRERLRVHPQVRTNPSLHKYIHVFSYIFKLFNFFCDIMLRPLFYRYCWVVWNVTFQMLSPFVTIICVLNKLAQANWN